jgi:hypothetical protein
MISKGAEKDFLQIIYNSATAIKKNVSDFYVK